MQPKLTEMAIAKLVAMYSSGSPVFLSSSMPCRDFDIVGAHFLHAVRDDSKRVVACNRGVNGIDGVISTALGFSKGLEGQQVFLLIGDVATIHDLGAISMVFNTHPGNRPDEPLGNLKVICVNNSGGSIFSFLPIKNETDVFDPYFSTPHNMSVAKIADAIRPGMTVSVSTTIELFSALKDPHVRLIECINLPSHVENVDFHKKVGQGAQECVLGILRGRRSRTR